MRTPDIEGVATHGGPESCVGVRKDVGEALAGVRAGRLMGNTPRRSSSGRACGRAGRRLQATRRRGQPRQARHAQTDPQPHRLDSEHRMKRRETRPARPPRRHRGDLPRHPDAARPPDTPDPRHAAAARPRAVHPHRPPRGRPQTADPHQPPSPTSKGLQMLRGVGGPQCERPSGPISAFVGRATAACRPGARSCRSAG